MTPRERMRRAREVRQADRIATRANRRALVDLMRREGVVSTDELAARLRATGWPASVTTIRRDLRALRGGR